MSEDGGGREDVKEEKTHTTGLRLKVKEKMKRAGYIRLFYVSGVEMKAKVAEQSTLKEELDGVCLRLDT